MSKTQTKGRLFILYDSRACGCQGTDEASVLLVCFSNKEAKREKGNYGAMACYSYEDKNGELVDERWEWDWYPK